MFWPVPMTIPVQRPAAMLVPEKSKLTLSWLTARRSLTGSVCFGTETDSPVKRAWSTRIEVELMAKGYF